MSFEKTLSKTLDSTALLGRHRRRVSDRVGLIFRLSGLAPRASTLLFPMRAQVGTRALVMPGSHTATVRALEVNGAPAALARAGDAVEVR